MSAAVLVVVRSVRGMKTPTNCASEQTHLVRALPTSSWLVYVRIYALIGPSHSAEIFCFSVQSLDFNH